MNTISLTRRQEQISGLIACGMSKKEIADKLLISEHTVDNTLRAVYLKTGYGKINELTGWWISRRFNINIDFNELKKQIIASSMLLLIFFDLSVDPSAIITARRSRRIRNENEIEYVSFIEI